MKKIFLFLFIIPLILSGQTKGKSNNTGDGYPHNFLGKDAKGYIGLTLYLKEQKNLQSSAYKGFITDCQKYINDIFSEYKEDYIYKYNDITECSNYEDMAGKYFLVLDAFVHPEYKKEQNKWFLELEEIESGDILYFLYETDFEYYFPFINTDYYEKLKEIYKGSIYVFRGVNWYDYTEKMYSINNNNEVDFSAGILWKCIDVGVDSKTYNLSIILENGNGEQVGYPMVLIEKADSKYSIINKIEADKYEKQFGLEDWSIILAHNVKMGFTEEMCTLSWMVPTEKYEILDGIKWVYKYQKEEKYLYFENGKLAAWDIIKIAE